MNSDLLRKNKVLTVNQNGGAENLTIEYNQQGYVYEESKIDANHWKKKLKFFS